MQIRWTLRTLLTLNAFSNIYMRIRPIYYIYVAIYSNVCIFAQFIYDCSLQPNLIKDLWSFLTVLVKAGAKRAANQKNLYPGHIAFFCIHFCSNIIKWHFLFVFFLLVKFYTFLWKWWDSIHATVSMSMRRWYDSGIKRNWRKCWELKGMLVILCY